MKIYRLLLLMLLGIPSFAQTHVFCAQDLPCTVTGNYQYTGPFTVNSTFTSSSAQSAERFYFSEPGGSGNHSTPSLFPTSSAFHLDLTNTTTTNKHGFSCQLWVRADGSPTNSNCFAGSIYTQPDNGGDGSVIWGAQTGGGNVGSFFNLASARPNGFTDYTTNANRLGVEVGVDGNATAVWTQTVGNTSAAGVGIKVNMTGAGVDTGIRVQPQFIAGGYAPLYNQPQSLSGSGTGPYTATLATTPIYPGTITITGCPGGVSGFDVFSGTYQTATTGTWTASGGVTSGTITYATGAVSITCNGTPAGAVTANFCANSTRRAYQVMNAAVPGQEEAFLDLLGNFFTRGQIQQVNGQPFLFTDNSGSLGRLVAQSDNNLILYSTNGSGALRPVLSTLMHSSTSSLVFSVPTNYATGVSEAYTEGTANGNGSTLDVLYGDSTKHALQLSNNNGSFFNVAQDIVATSSAFATATTAGTCVQNTTAVTGATTAMTVSVSPVSTPGVGAQWSGFVSSAGNVTINECAVAVSAGGSIAFNIRVIP